MTISCPALWHHCQTTLIYVPAIAGNVLRSDAEKLIANLPEPRKHRNLKRNGTLDSGQDLSLQMVIVFIRASTTLYTNITIQLFEVHTSFCRDYKSPLEIAPSL